jgi:choline dehydrogenase-like flavoprotein
VASFDYHVVIIGSGFGGSVAVLRAAEKGYRVGVMESGRRWKDEDIPKTQWDRKQQRTRRRRPYLRVFGQPGAHVMHGSVMPANRA